MTLSVLDAARESAHQPALVLDNQVVTYGELATLVRRRVPELLIDDRQTPLPLVCEPALPTLVTLFACFEARRPVALLHPRWPAAQRERIAESCARFRLSHAADDEAALVVAFTSGSTGEPKGVELSRRAILASAAASADRLGWRPDDRWLLALSFAHVGGLSVLTRCLLARRPVVLGGGARFSAAAVARLMANDRVTLASLVPTQLAQLLADSTLARPPASLRALLLGGAAASRHLLERAGDLGWPVLTTYGLTEACSQVATERPGLAHRRAQRGADPLAGVEVRCRAGRIEVRSPVLFTAYHTSNGAHPALDPDGWFQTQDLGRIDGAGRLHVFGRADDLITTGGEKVAPVEVEQEIEGCVGVREACVFGVADPIWGQRLAAALTVAPDFRLEVLVSWIRDRLAPFQRPRLVALLEALPVTEGGKLDRRAVAALSEPLLHPLPG